MERESSSDGDVPMEDGGHVIRRAGHFWLRSNPSRRVPGAVILQGRASPRVHLDGVLAGARVTERVSEGVVRHTVDEDLMARHHNVDGELDDGTAVSVTGAVTPDPLAPLTGPEDMEGLHAFVGAHVDVTDDRFTSFRFRPRQLGRWNTAGVHPDRGTVPGEATEVSLELGPPIDGAPSPDVIADEACWLRIDCSPQTFSELGRRYVTPLVNLVALASGARPGLSAMEVASESRPWVAVHSALKTRVDGHDASPWLVPWEDIGVSGAAAWIGTGPAPAGRPARSRPGISKVDQLGTLPSVVADAVDGTGMTVQTRLLLLATVAEGVHRAESLWWVLAFVLLSETGISEVTLGERLRTSRRYESFRRRASSWYMEVWPADA